MLKELIRGRGAFFEMLIAALMLAFGVNLLAASFFTYSKLPTWALVLVGAALASVALLLIGRKVVTSRHVDRSYRAVFLLDRKSNELIRIPRYRFSENLSQYFKGLFAEHPAARKLWDSEPLRWNFGEDKTTVKSSPKNSESGQLVREAVEYLVLNELSMHLTDYFHRSALDKSLIVTLGREDVPSILFRNRFLDTFSKPMHERSAFVDDFVKDKERMKNIVAAYGPNNVLFSAFDLVLPAKATVTRAGTSTITVDTPKFSMSLDVCFDGFGASFPSKFEALYLGITKDRDTTAFSVQITVRVKFKLFSLLSVRGWEYHLWLDSFVKSLDKRLSAKRFLKRIRWEAAHTVAQVIRNSRRSGSPQQAQQSSAGDVRDARA